MNRPLRFILLLALLPALFTNCKKDGAFSTPVVDSANLTVLLPTCLIRSESSDQTIQNGNIDSLYYDGSGNLMSVLSYNSGSPTIIDNITITAKQIDIELDGVGPLQIYDFSDDIYTSQPQSYTLTRPSTPSSNRSLTVAYDNSGRVSKVTAYKASTNAYLQELDVTYDKAGNAVSLTYAAGTGTAVAKSSYLATSFDDRHNPYDSAKGAALMMYNWDFFSGGNLLAVFQHLSRHNPQGWTITDGANSNTVSMVYQYNDKGYPTSISQTAVGIYNGVTTTTQSVLSYSYDCQ